MTGRVVEFDIPAEGGAGAAAGHYGGTHVHRAYVDVCDVIMLNCVTCLALAEY